MKKTSIAASVLLLLLLLLALVPATFGFYPASVMEACDANPTTTTELRYVYWAFDDISSIFSGKNYYSWDPNYQYYYTTQDPLTVI